jgi:small basic protein
MQNQRIRPVNIWLPVSAFVLGFAVVWGLQPEMPVQVADYLPLALLAGMDAIFGGIRAGLDRRFRSDVFFTGFLCNMLLAVLLGFIGDQIGIELYLAAVVILGGRVFLNLSMIRRQILDRMGSPPEAVAGAVPTGAAPATETQAL